jgi:hypothetical protein
MRQNEFDYALEQLDLLLLTVAKPRRVQQDGVRFQSLRYIVAGAKLSISKLVA